MRDQTLQAETAEGSEADDSASEGSEAGAAYSAELDENVEAREVEPSLEMTAEGYDEAVESRGPFIAEPEILAQYSADPVALTEAEPFSEDDIVLQEPGRDLRPDSVVPSPDITASDAAALESLSEFGDEEKLADEFAMSEELASQAPEQTSAPADAATAESTDDEKQDASSDAAN
jgi:hypothetical protein